MALRAGVDLEAARPDVYKRLVELVHNGTIEEASDRRGSTTNPESEI